MRTLAARADSEALLDQLVRRSPEVESDRGKGKPVPRPLARSGCWLLENDLAIARLDELPVPATSPEALDTGMLLAKFRRPRAQTLG